MSGVIYREAPVGIEPTNRGFAVVQEPAHHSTALRCAPPELPKDRPGFVFLCPAVVYVPRLCPNILTTARLFL